MRRGWALGCVVLLLALAPGCRLMRNDGPLSKSLVESRKLSQRGVSAFERGDSATAESLLAQAVSACPADPAARRHYAEALWKQGNRREALQQMDEAIRLAGDDDTLLTRAGEMSLELGEVSRAQEQARMAIDLNPKSADAWVLRGRVTQQAGNPRQALADYHRALGLAPENRQVLLAIAETYRTLGEPQRALVNLQTLVDTYPPGEEPQQVLYLQGLAQATLQRHEDAVESYLAARDRATPNPELLCRLAESQAAAGYNADALRSAQQALALDPGHAGSRAVAERMTVAAAGSNNLRR